MEIDSVQIGNIEIEGYAGDYIFETLKSTGDFYESEILKKWQPFFQHIDVIFDVGANIGNHTVRWASSMPSTRIFSFEPLPDNFARLSRNIDKNGFGDRVRAIPKAVGSRSGKVAVKEVDPQNMGGTSFITVDTTNNPSEDVELISIDQFCESEGITSVDIVKIDTEGFEYEVLCGMTKLLLESSPIVWVEVSKETYPLVRVKMEEFHYYIADVEGFNILFWPDHRRDAIPSYDPWESLKCSFANLNKANFYYKAYLKSKEWIAAKDKCLEQMTNDNITLGQFKSLSQEYAEALQKYQRNLAEEIEMLEQCKKAIQRLEVQNNYLKHENEAFRKKISLITDTWYGRLAIKLYRVLIKIKNICR